MSRNERCYAELMKLLRPDGISCSRFCFINDALHRHPFDFPASDSPACRAQMLDTFSEILYKNSCAELQK